MNKYIIFIVILMNAFALYADIPPLRRVETFATMENDSFRSGGGFWSGDDEGETFSWRFASNWLFEDRDNPNSNVLLLSFFASTSLRTRFDGTETADGRRIQFPEEQNLYFLQAKFGRDFYWRLQAGISDLNFRPMGRGWLATFQQYKFHELTESADVENIDLHKSTVLSFIGGGGMGGELSPFSTIFQEYLLFRYDFGFFVDSAEIRDTYFTSNCALVLGTSPVTRGDRPLFSLTLECEMKANRERFDLNAMIGANFVVPVYHWWHLSTGSFFRIPIVQTKEDFYDRNPELIIGIYVGFLWDKGP